MCKTKYQNLNAIQKFAIELFIENAAMANGRVLEIGSDIEGRVARHVAARCNAFVTDINTASNFNPSIEGRNISWQRFDCRDMQFSDNSFDAIISVATFEHVHNLHLALQEMYRVLKPGGRVVTVFGPLWSSPQGHHLWAISGDDIVSFWNPKYRNPLDDFSHLLMSPPELRTDLKSKGETPEMIEAIIEAVYCRSDINRMIHVEYGSVFHRSPFNVIMCTHWNRFQIDPNIERELVARWGAENDYGVSTLKVVLEKPRM